MTDPKFETRAELEAWAVAKAGYGGKYQTRQMMLDQLADIRRVTLAHSHLIGEK